MSGCLGKCVLEREELRTLKCMSGRIEEGSWRQPGRLPFPQDEGSGVIFETGKKGQPLSEVFFAVLGANSKKSQCLDRVASAENGRPGGRARLDLELALTGGSKHDGTSSTALAP